MAPEIFNCSPPDTGNMELLARFGSDEQKAQYLQPLLDGEIRSAFCMTEADVASSDATNVQARIARDGDEYVINGRKWWSSGVGDPRCTFFIFMGKTDPDAPRHQQQSMILVPRDADGVTIERLLTVFGYDDAPHGHAEISFEDVRDPAANMIAGDGRGFEIAQARLGPGRIHHCMRSVGVAERALQVMCERALNRVAFGKRLAEMGSLREDIARSRLEIDQARLLTLHAAHMMDTVGNKAARAQIAAIKVVGPNVALNVLDRAIQVHGGMGVSGDIWLAAAWANQRDVADRRRSRPGAPGGGRQARAAEAPVSGDEQLVEIREAHRFDESALLAYLESELDGFAGGPLRVRQFEGGQSNPTYLVETDSDRYVLRKQPPGEPGARRAPGRPRVPHSDGAA